MHNKPIALVILDGFGTSNSKLGNAIQQADTPHITRWLNTMPHTTLNASGAAVGLPDGYVGNSEVGHYTIGAGRIVPQATTIIGTALEDGSFYTNPVLTKALTACAQAQKQCHIIGILSDAGIHGHQEYIVAYARAAHEQGVKAIYVHAILDGSDTLTHTAEERIEQLTRALQPYNAQLATMQGRFYALDGNKNYDRTIKAYVLLTDPTTPITEQWHARLYEQNKSEEYCEPMRILPGGYIEPGDTVLFTACRSDRIRQLVRALSGDTKILGKIPPVEQLTLISPVPYGEHIKTQWLYTYPPIHNTLKEILCSADRTVFSIAETEKYAHVTYFFNGEKEQVLTCEVRHLIPSLSVTSYENNPEMRAAEITDTVLRSLAKDPKDFYLINYANADMVGHSGDLPATIRAVEFLDHELGRLYTTLVGEMDGALFITSDHGNAEQKIDPKTGNPSPTHTHNPVPFMVVTKKPLPATVIAKMHGLADIAPVILTYMGIPVPPDMTGSN